jgi:hypothetical protein
MEERFKTYEEFWPYYMKEHSKKGTRILHYIGTTIGFCCLLALFVTFQIKWLGIALFVGYLFAWLGHFLIEKNRPATFKYPFWSFISDWRMWYMALTSLFTKTKSH